MKLAKLTPATSPVLVNVPHAGTFLPAEIAERLTDEGRAMPDTDWYVDKLYPFAGGMGIGLMQATHSRYVIDLNRPAGEQAVYGRRTTGLVPTETFSGKPLYSRGNEPGVTEQQNRVKEYWKPYHQALQDELLRIRAEFGWAVMLDAHSIRSTVPLLFDGELPHLNLGTFEGKSADARLIAEASDWMLDSSAYRTVRDGRFKGGFNTRYYGQPDKNQHVLQLEIAQSAYMDEGNCSVVEPQLQLLQGALKKLMERLLAWEPVA